MKHIIFGPYERLFKRPLDIIISVLALIILSPLLIIIALMIKIKMGGKVLFSQHRIGKNEKEFAMYKFRSMLDARDEKGIYLPDDERITPIGKFIRKTSIDELPSLINIVKGDMSIIGPRPLPTRYLSRYNDVQRRRHEVRPGLSNPSTINGRNLQSWEKQFEGDVWYVDHITLKTDLKSIIDTLKSVLKRDGVTAEDGGARGEFIGTASKDELQTDAEGNYMKL